MSIAWLYEVRSLEGDVEGGNVVKSSLHLRGKEQVVTDNPRGLEMYLLTRAIIDGYTQNWQWENGQKARVFSAEHPSGKLRVYEIEETQRVDKILLGGL